MERALLIWRCIGEISSKNDENSKGFKASETLDVHCMTLQEPSNVRIPVADPTTSSDYLHPLAHPLM